MKEQTMLSLIAKALKYSEINGEISNTDSDEVYHRLESIVDNNKSLTRRLAEIIRVCNRSKI